MSVNWLQEERTIRTRDNLLTVIDERRRTARHAIEEDTRPICEHCNRRSDFTEHWARGSQRTMFSEEFQEQVWWTCDWCESPTENDPYSTKIKKPMSSEVLAPPWSCGAGKDVA